jgi:hypothetical protein
MNTTKAIGAAAALCSTIAAPVFAQDYRPYGAPYARGPVMVYPSYGQAPGDYLPPQNTDEFWNLVNHGFTGRDPSRVGSGSPSVNPSGS